MPTYEYQCRKCGLKFDRRQAITAAPVTECPECNGQVQMLVSGGAGFIMKESGHDRTAENGDDCSLKQTGKTCCGREERRGKSSCEGES